ncbi:prolyl-tRNA synthetase associated domain-containing protein [Alkaliphilus oremlandii]|uniref:YbaK/prolyl-tRNA synthetase associated region n=1 Tax=Alkaliphilus oremlandii (strain OhILAs) TaxID=350688 RepID=A8MJB8_ALKOO|nr:prolyl-tRNA synthetase associated domain-containing protein [Alkaliphilus oremlandii]ABW19900.1 YbaK/prolyl-tRNA synthetase associated region [Alkaliphilus oremlandii OhILAs]
MDIREKKVYETLDMLNIVYDRYTHPAVYTIAEIEEHELKGDNIAHCKNLFLRNSKGDQHYLVVIESSKKTSTKDLAKQIGSTRLSFASPDRMEQYLGLEPGAVSPFGLINDENKEVVLLIDKDLQKREKITFHPNINTASITITYEDFQRYVQWCSNTVQYVDVE